MSAVVDASILLAAAVDASAGGTWAENIVGGGELLAPHLVLVEATNVLRRLERANEISALEAASARVDILALDIDLLEFAPFSERVWELRDNLSCYDAWYVAVAEAVGLPLATLDRRLARAPGPRCEFLTPN